MTLYGKSADREDGGLVSQRLRLTQVRIWASFIVKGKRMWQVIADFMVSESFVHAAVHIGVLKFMILLQTFSKTNVFSVLKLLSLYD